MVKRRIKDLKPLKSLISAFLAFFLLVTLPPLKLEAQANQQLKKNYDAIIRMIAQKYNLDSSLIHSIIRTESNYNNFAISSKGAMGLMQLMPETAKAYGVKNVFDPRENIEAGVKYLKDLERLYNGRTNLVLAAYNAGQEAIKKYKGIPPYPETRNYIRRVMTSYNKTNLRTKNKIYKFYDSSGRLVLTNTPYLFSIKKGTEKANNKDY